MIVTETCHGQFLPADTATHVGVDTTRLIATAKAVAGDIATSHSDVLQDVLYVLTRIPEIEHPYVVLEDTYHIHPRVMGVVLLHQFSEEASQLFLEVVRAVPEIFK